MTFPLSLSGSVVGRKVEQRFGLLGVARLLKMAELVVERADPAGKRISGVLAWGDFQAALHCTQAEATEFLAYCEQARAIDRGHDDGRLRLVLVGELAALVVPPETPKQQQGRTLFDTPEQWALWFAEDLNCPPYLRNDPATRRLFRHWCASNVTLDEVEAATAKALAQGEAPHPAVLHDHIKALRQDKLRAVD